ncbi:hypothetical protein BKA70DRAFT_1235734 [Coprinopsis sp. MPI-PUGE-AT-0042]|nr:hypothetical protein BKA70DRAFT_1235734 [Coprinopsis sp. MPI-PUGE-AT-0042]
MIRTLPGTIPRLPVAVPIESNHGLRKLRTNEKDSWNSMKEDLLAARQINALFTSLEALERGEGWGAVWTIVQTIRDVTRRQAQKGEEESAATVAPKVITAGEGNLVSIRPSRVLPRCFPPTATSNMPGALMLPHRKDCQNELTRLTCECTEIVTGERVECAGSRREEDLQQKVFHEDSPLQPPQRKSAPL